MYRSEIKKFNGKSILAYGRGNLICTGILRLIPNENGEDLVRIVNHEMDIFMPISNLYYVIERPLQR